jgi:GMP synthase-like glutamine amidotransferase
LTVLSLLHQEDAPTGVFAAEIDDLEEASLAYGPGPRKPISHYDALIILGGAMHVDQDGEHAWLGEERAFIADALEAGVPTLGVCLGSQILAQVAGADVGPLETGHEIGWHEVENTTGQSDPVLGALPDRFLAFQWHSYGSQVPPRATALAKNGAALQAYRLDDAPGWGIQFHAEVDEAIIGSWMETSAHDRDVIEAGIDLDELRAQNEREIARWTALGRDLARAFLATGARRRGRPAPART